MPLKAFTMEAREFSTIRRSAGLTPSRLAQALGFSGLDSFPVSLWESGSVPIPPWPSAMMLIFKDDPQVLTRMLELMGVQEPAQLDYELSTT